MALECESKTNAKEVMEMVIKSNSFRKTALEKENMVCDLSKAIDKLENELKQCK